jgi:hypothetical protein
MLEENFPKLKVTGYTVCSPASVEYNCIAWAAGETEVWWWPDALDQFYWPPDAPRRETLDAFVEAFKTLGYSVCEDAKQEKNFEKIAIYVDSTGKPTHVSRQLDSGLWTSKLGRIEDIEHTFEGLTGTIYGTVAAIMKRLK